MSDLRSLLLGWREFKSREEIAGYIVNSVNFDPVTESPESAKTLLLFQTSKQRTWLVSTRERVYCTLDDVRKPEPHINAPCVYLGGRRIADVTAEPVFQEPIRSIAEQYDMQLDPAYREVMTYRSPTTGNPVSSSFLVPYTRPELVKKRKHFKLRADHNFGFMGRGPDFMNQFVTGWHLIADRFARAGARFGEHATRYYEYVREHDLSSSRTC